MVENSLPTGPRVSVSSNGSQVAVFGTGSSNGAQDGKFMLFQTKRDNNTVPVWEFKDHPDLHELHQDLHSFTGYAKFVNTDVYERFIACDGQNLSVYTTKENWKQLYSIQLLKPPKLPSTQLPNVNHLLAQSDDGRFLMPEFDDDETAPLAKFDDTTSLLEKFAVESALLAQFTAESAQGEYFLWHKGWNVSVWHLELGSMVSCLSLGLGALKDKGLTENHMKARPPKIVEFLYSDHDTIALRVVINKPFKADMALLFSARTGRELAETSVSLSEVVRDAQDNVTHAAVLGQFDRSTDGSTLRMPFLLDSDVRNTLGFLMKTSRHKCYGIYQTSADKPSFIISRQESKLAIRHMDSKLDVDHVEASISALNGAGHLGCTRDCSPFKVLNNNGDSEDVEMPDQRLFKVATKKSEMTRKLFLEVTSQSGGNVLLVDLEGSETVTVFRNLWIVTIQGPASLSIWQLPKDESQVCLLVLHWAGFPVGSWANGDLSVDVCKETQQVRFRHDLYKKSPVLIPIDVHSASNKENTDVFIAGVQDIAKQSKATKEATFKKAVIQYLRLHIDTAQTSGDTSQSIVSVLDKDFLKEMDHKLLVFKDLVLCQFKDVGGWIRRGSSTKDHGPLDVALKMLKQNSSRPFAEEIIRWYYRKMKDEKRANYFYLLLENLPEIARASGQQPALEEILLDIIQWCFAQAKEKDRPEELRDLIIGVPELLTMHPRLARKITRLFAFFHVHDRQAIIDNLIISNPPLLSRLFGSGPLRFHERRNLTLQFRHDPNKPDKDRLYFKEGVFVAPFSLLWSVKDEVKSDKFPEVSESALRVDSEISKSNERRPMNPDHDFVMIRTSNSTTLWKSLGYLVYFQFVPQRHIYVRPRYYSLDVLDNPAIKALVEYKWNAFGYMLWLIRFFAQCVYYLLIVVAAFWQVYSEDPTYLHNTFVAIIAMASWFLFHEIRQFGSSVVELVEIRKSAWLPSTQWYKRQYMPRYLKSQYNWLDLLAFTFPLVASIFQLVNIKEGNPDRAVWLLSFSLVIVFLHMVAELRVFRPVCKYVTIVLRIISDIKIFFAVFALGLLYFSLAIEHVLRGRSSGVFRVRVPSDDIDTSNSTNPDGFDFPRHFLGAITSTYFIMGGRYDPVNEELKTGDNWALHIMIVIYFFFTVILMLNVLIALINGGFDKADGYWHLVLLENRLRYVESAENMSY
ncbi:hypothetical protein BG000_008286, partial [Podila horticola]